MKPFATVLGGVRRESKGRGKYNIQCNTIQNYNNESPLYNECILIKMKKYRKLSSPPECLMWPFSKHTLFPPTPTASSIPDNLYSDPFCNFAISMLQKMEPYTHMCFKSCFFGGTRI
jgi:hypothetical protein